jgi:UDP-N-acetyl-D-glucosamine/UDP-N-acetyl-D-galactosamine dehydrogenase
VEIHDPLAHLEEVMHEYGLECFSELNGNHYEAVILAVAHDAFFGMDIRSFGSCKNCVVYDVKGVLQLEGVDGRL